MSTYEDSLLAARFAALAPEPLAGNWDDVLRRAGATLESQQPLERSRGREGHLRRFLVVLAAAILVVVVGTAAAYGVRSFILERGFIGLPPEGATPSSPASGELEIFYWGHGDRVEGAGDGPRIEAWLYADGRLISWGTASDGSGSANPLSTGFLEQRLTPEGVELLRSEVASTGLFDHDRILVTDRDAPRLVDLRNGDRLVHVGVGADGECANVHAPCLHRPPGAIDATPEQANALDRLNRRLSDPASWLPESAWADRDIRAYVSSKYAVCYSGWPPDQQIDQPRVLALLPAATRDLLGDATPRQGPLFGEPGNFRPSYEFCSDLTTEEARAVAVALDDAGLERAGGARLHYRVEAPSSNPDEVTVYFEPYLPHGEIICTVCG